MVLRPHAVYEGDGEGAVSGPSVRGESVDVAPFLAMDIAACAVTSLLGRFAWVHLEEPLARSAPLPSIRSSTVFFILFSFQYALIKTYRLFVYPYFRSPLRNLPGPKVNIPISPFTFVTLPSFHSGDNES